MLKMRETVIANCEEKFLIKCLSEKKRLDGRAFGEFRDIEIQFSKEWGCCHVSLGRTCVVAQTSCEIQQPKSSRPSEGILNVNIELNPLAAPHFDPGRQSELAVQLNRLLEKFIKDSKAIDLESLCIKTREKVWLLRVDINVLNHDGNLLDCASVAMLASLAHFRRPDVTCDGEEFVINSYQERDPIPTVIRHYPVGISFSIFSGSDYILADPLLLEEGVADAVLIVGLNSFKELCGFHLEGRAELKPNIVLNTVSKAVSRAAVVIEQIKNALKIDHELRQKKCPVGFHISLNFEWSQTFNLETCLNKWSDHEKKRKKKKKGEMKIQSKEDIPSPVMGVLGQASAAYVPYENDEDGRLWRKDSEEENVMFIENSKEERIHIEDTDCEDDVIILSDKIENS